MKIVKDFAGRTTHAAFEDQNYRKDVTYKKHLTIQPVEPTIIVFVNVNSKPISGPG